MILPLAGGATALGLLWGLDRLATRVVCPVPSPGDGDPRRAGVSVDIVEVESGGSPLATWVLRPETESDVARLPVAVLTHGWGRSRSMVLGVAHRLVAAGVTVVSADVRGHGHNRPEPYVTVRHYRDDVAAVARYARAAFPGRPLALVGHSMGGAASVLAAAEGAPADGVAVVAAPADILEVTADLLSERGLPGRAMTVLLRPFWWPRVGGRFGPLTPERRIGDVGVPVLIVHPERDERVTWRHAERLGRAGGGEVRVVEGATHSGVLDDPRLVDDHLLPFLESLGGYGVSTRG